MTRGVECSDYKTLFPFLPPHAVSVSLCSELQAAACKGCLIGALFFSLGSTNGKYRQAMVEGSRESCPHTELQLSPCTDLLCSSLFSSGLVGVVMIPYCC